MTLTEKTELALIPVVGAVVWLLAPVLPDKLAVGRLLLIVSALILFQGLVRDIWLLFRDTHAEPAPRKVARCMCVESTVGVTGIVIGLILLGAGIGQPVLISGWLWSVLIMVVLSTGFLMKDYVVEWSPWRIRQEKNHMNIVFTWKKQK